MGFCVPGRRAGGLGTTLIPILLDHEGFEIEEKKTTKERKQKKTAKKKAKKKLKTSKALAMQQNLEHFCCARRSCFQSEPSPCRRLSTVFASESEIASTVLG